MRLICPNCGAQYEVPIEVIPTEGRDVQCSACSGTWFQAHPDHDPGLADEGDDLRPEAVEAPEPDDAPEAPVTEPEQESVAAAPIQRPPVPRAQPVQRSIDPQVADVLREEAELEQAARDAERAGTLESQPDLGLDDPQPDEATRRANQARARMAQMRGEAVPPEVAIAAATAAAGSRKDLLPDIEEINSSLRASGDRRAPAQATDADLPDTKPKTVPRKRGFRFGFYSMILTGAMAVGGYIYGPQLSEVVPQAVPVVAQYTEYVETARSWLAGSVDRGLAWLDQMASENL